MIVLTSLVSLAHAQVSSSSSSHLTFKGVPIDGTLREYTLKMENIGFELLGTDNGVSLLQGDFASYKKCLIGVVSLKQKDVVSRITVVFPDQGTWSGLESNYFTLKEMLTEKYGEPSDVIERFDGIEPRDDGDKMHYVQFDRCKYYTIYETDKGTIQLQIHHNETTSCYIMLTYYDKVNGEIVKKSAMSDL